MSTTTFEKPIVNPTTPTDAAILAALITAAWQAIVTDPDVSPFRRVEALSAKIPDLSEAASACRMAMTLIEPESHPDEVRRRASAANAAKAKKEAAAKAQTEAVTRRIEEGNLVQAAKSAEAMLTRARGIAARYERPGADVDDERRVLAAGAVAQAETALATAEKALADHRAKGAKGAR